MLFDLDIHIENLHFSFMSESEILLGVILP